MSVFVSQEQAQEALWALGNLSDSIDNTKNDINSWFLISQAMLVFMMNAGFAFLEAGAERAKNMTNLLTKVLVDSLIAASAWWIAGYAFAFGTSANQFIGRVGFAGTGYSGPFPQSLWYFGWTFLCASSVIVSGAVAGRIRFEAYLGWAIFNGFWVYPLAVHWIWSMTGWMSSFSINGNGCVFNDVCTVDFAGAIVVHMSGGAAALVCVILMGARLDRWDASWEGRPVRATNALWSTLGLFFLWFGWLGFNVGSLGSITNGRGFLAGVIAQNTTLFGAGSALVAAVLQKIFKKNWDLEVFIKAVLAGLVSSTGGAGLMLSWSAFTCGVIAGLVYYAGKTLFDYLRIDDALDAVPIHFMCGWWSTIAVGLFADQAYMIQFYGISTHWGLFRGGGGKILGVNVLAATTVTLWVFFWATLYFGLLKLVGFLRVSKEIERMGIDLKAHSGPRSKTTGSGSDPSYASQDTTGGSSTPATVS